jgi:uncharacterized protein YqgV (UPF0045/DUF77 family)
MRNNGLKRAPNVTSELPILRLAAAIKKARGCGVELTKLFTLVETGALDRLIAALDEAEELASASALPVRTVLAIILHSERHTRRTHSSRR